MAITRQTKEEHLKELNNLISKSKIIVVWDYLGLKSNDINELRSEITGENGFNKVYKNRIAKLAFEKAGKKEIVDILTGPSSFLFIEDESSSALSKLNKFIEKNENISFKAGYINDEFYDQAGIQEIAALPSKDDLLSMLASSLQGTIRNLAYSLSQISSQKKD